jgi:hypothetical protein
VSRRCLQRGRRRYGIITVETIDSVVNKICSAGIPLQGGVRSRRRVRRRAFKGGREETCMRWGAAKHLCKSRTRTEEGVYASRLYPTYPDKPGNTMVPRSCQLDGKHAIASRVRLRLLHQPSAVTEEAQSKMALLRVCGFLWGCLLLRNQNYSGSESRARMPALVQVGLDSAYFQTQCMKHPSCGLQARVGPARSSLTATAPHGREPSRNGAPVPTSHSLLARSLPALLPSQGGNVVTYFKDFMQQGIKPETEDATTAASRL